MNKLTTKEQAIVTYLETQDGDLEDWFFADEMKIPEIEKNQLGGVVSSLIKKGIVICDGHPTAPAIALRSVVNL